MTQSLHPDAEATYFAYGTLLELAEIHRFCPTARALGIYRLKGYRLGFEACGPDPGSGGCTLLVDANNVMYGVLYGMPADERKHLESVSGLDRGLWAARKVTLWDENDRTVSADTFYIPEASGSHVPSAAYVRPILAGAREVELPADYIDQLDAIVAQARQA